MMFNKLLAVGLLISLSIVALPLNYSDDVAFDKPGKIKTYWAETWGGSNDDWAMGIDVYDGNIYVAGISDGKAILLKYDDDGNLIWNRTWAGEGTAGAGDLAVQGNYIYVTGSTAGQSADVFLLKYDTEGTLIWAKTWGGGGEDMAKGIAISNDYIYLCGTTGSFGALSGDILLLKYDMEGNLIWYKIWGGKEREEGNRIVVDGNEIYISGVTASYGQGGDDVVFLKYDINGNLAWRRTWGGDDTDWGVGIDEMEDYIYIAGYTYSYQPHVLILKYDKDGKITWERRWGESGADNAYAICTYNGAVYVSGETNSYGKGGDIFLLKYSDGGTIEWAKTWGGAEEDVAYDMDIENDRIYVAGYTESYGEGGKDVIVFKCNLEGKKLSSMGVCNPIEIINGKILFMGREIIPLIKEENIYSANIN